MDQKVALYVEKCKSLEMNALDLYEGRLVPRSDIIDLLLDSNTEFKGTRLHPILHQLFTYNDEGISRDVIVTASYQEIKSYGINLSNPKEITLIVKTDEKEVHQQYPQLPSAVKWQ